MTTPALEPLFKIFFICLTFLWQNFSFCRLKFPGKITEKFMEIKAQVPVAHEFVSRTLCSVALILEQPLYENYSTLDSHTNTVIFHALLHVKTVIRSLVRQRVWKGKNQNLLMLLSAEIPCVH